MIEVDLVTNFFENMNRIAFYKDCINVGDGEEAGLTNRQIVQHASPAVNVGSGVYSGLAFLCEGSRVWRLSDRSRAVA